MLSDVYALFDHIEVKELLCVAKVRNFRCRATQIGSVSSLVSGIE